MCVLVHFQFKLRPGQPGQQRRVPNLVRHGAPLGHLQLHSGLVAYYSLTAGFLFYGYVQRGVYPIWLVAVVTCDVLLTAAVSGSRTCLISIGIVTIVAVICVLCAARAGWGCWLPRC